MNIIMKNIEIQSVEEMEEFLHANQKAEFVIETRKGKYDFISRTQYFPIPKLHPNA